SGRTPLGQAEVNGFEDAIEAIEEADPNGHPPPGSDLSDGRRIFVRALMQEEASRLRWSEFFMDALHVNRVELKDQSTCYGTPPANSFDDGQLAAFLRDHDPSETFGSSFDMGDLVSSGLALDDLSVIYRANLFAMMAKPIYGANVDELEME